MVVTRDNFDVRFFSFTNATSLGPIADDHIDYSASTAAVKDDMAVVGSQYENDDTGAVYVYERDENGSWNRTMRFAPDGLRRWAWFGWAVAIDGDAVVVGAPRDGLGWRRNTNSSPLSPPARTILPPLLAARFPGPSGNVIGRRGGLLSSHLQPACIESIKIKGCPGKGAQNSPLALQACVLRRHCPYYFTSAWI